MNQHLRAKIHQLRVANLGNRLTIPCDWRLDLAYFSEQLNDPELIRGSLVKPSWPGQTE